MTEAITCATCRACCCKLEVMLMGEDEPPVEYTEQDPWGGWIMLRSKVIASLRRQESGTLGFVSSWWTPWLPPSGWWPWRRAAAR